jgi:predicted nucleotidyltransferase
MDEIQSALSGTSLAVMLYGSRARGSSRADSDVDVLQLVLNHPRSYSKGRVNVAAYTPGHLAQLADRGSLFVRHLRDEGVILDDQDGVLARLLDRYRAPVDYLPLKRELAVTFGAVVSATLDDLSPGLIRLAIYATRTALYIKADELGRLVFDTEKVCAVCGMPGLAARLRSADPKVAYELASIGLHLIGIPAPIEMPRDLASAGIWAQDQFPMAATLLEAVIAGRSEIEYTALTLPPG